MDSSNGLNVGDVTGPRWAGGTRNPDGAEKAWEEHSRRIAPYPSKPGEHPDAEDRGRAYRAAFMAGWSAAEAAKADAWDEGYGDDMEATTPRTNPYRSGTEGSTDV